MHLKQLSFDYRHTKIHYLSLYKSRKQKTNKQQNKNKNKQQQKTEEMMTPFTT